MGSKYLKRSATGWYSYRRRIPAKLQKAIGKLEFKQRLETKDETTALIRLARTNQIAEAEIRFAESQLSSSDLKLTRQEAMSAARQMLIREGFHPDQKPTLPADYIKEQKEQFYKDKEQWDAPKQRCCAPIRHLEDWLRLVPFAILYPCPYIY